MIGRLLLLPSRRRMPTMPNAAEVFQIIPVSRADVLGGVPHDLIGMSYKNLKKMGALNAKFGPLIAAEKRGAVIRRLCEVYFLPPFAHEEEASFNEKYGTGNAQTVYFFNQTALNLADEFGVKLPDPVGTITRGEMEELACGLGTFLHWDTFSVA
jgi:hypothetical protein